MIPEIDPQELDPDSIIPEELLAVLLEAIQTFEENRIDVMVKGATKGYLKGEMIAHTRLDTPFKSSEVKDDIYSFLKTYKAQLDEGYTIIQGEKNYWLKKRTLEERQKIFDIISNGITEGKSPPKVAKEFEKYFGMAKRDAVTLARTETAYVQATGRDIRYKKFGVKKVKWLLGKNPCDVCRALGGKIFMLADPQIRQPKHVRCTCDLSPQPDDAIVSEPVTVAPTPVREQKVAPVKPIKEPVKKVEVPKKSPEEVKSIIKNFEKDIKDNEIEHGGVFSQNGDLLIKRKGEADRISWSSEERAIMQGTKLTHNHPSGAGFSSDDIKFACEHRLNEMRAIGSDRSYSMHFADGRDFTPGDWKKIENVYDKNYQMGVAKVRIEFAGKEWDTEKATKQVANYTWSRTVKEIDGLKYKVEVVK